MANTTIQLKRSGITSNVPTSLEYGELSLNYADGLLFYKNSTGQIVSFSSGADSFGTVNANGTFVVAGAPGSIVTLIPGTGINITGDAINDTITISATGGGSMDYPYVNTAVAGANAWTNTVFGYSNTYTNTVGAASNGWANTVVAGANAWTNTVVAGANAWANTVAAGANAWSNTKISSSGYTANTIFFANSAGYFSNSTNLQFFSSNNVLLLSGTINANVVTASNGSIASSVGYLGVPQDTQSTNYTLTISDQGKHIYVTANSTITIPANSSVSFPIGATISILTNANVTANVAITTDTLYLGGIGTTGTRTVSSYGMATIIKVTATSWYISGAGVA